MAKPGAQNEQTLKRVIDYVPKGGADLEGERVELETILGKDIIIKDFVFLTSTKFPKEGRAESEFVVIQLELEGKLCTTATGGGVVVRKLKQMPKNYLPAIMKIVRVKGKTGTKYLDIE